MFADQPETRNPRLLPGNAEGFPEVFMSMGETAENVADKYDVTREEMDRYALQSQMRAVLARKDGIFAREIIPVPLSSGSTMTNDDGPRPDTTPGEAGLAEAGVPRGRPGDRRELLPAQRRCGGGRGDVAGARRAARDQPLARIISTGVSSLEPELMGLGPIESSRQALARAGMTIDDVDVVEINEAFAAQVIPSARGTRRRPVQRQAEPARRAPSPSATRSA